MRRANGAGSLAGLLTGFGLSVIMVLAATAGANGSTAGWVTFLNGIHLLHFTAYLFLICSLVVIVVSFMTPAPQEVFHRAASTDDIKNLKLNNVKVGDAIEDKLDNYVWKKSLFTSETEELKDLVWYKNYRIQSVILLILTAILVGYFW